MKDVPFKFLERVVWRYRHHTNSKTSFWREKHGQFVVMKLEKRYVTHGPYQRSTYLAKVQFDDNKGMSIVNIHELRLEEKT